MLRCVLTERVVSLFTTNVNQFIRIAQTQSMPICIPIPDYRNGVKRLDDVEDVSFPGKGAGQKLPPTG